MSQNLTFKLSDQNRQLKDAKCYKLQYVILPPKTNILMKCSGQRKCSDKMCYQTKRKQRSNSTMNKLQGSLAEKMACIGDCFMYEQVTKVMI